MRTWKTLLILTLSLSLLVSCGGSQALITKPAADLNLTAEELGAGYTMTGDEGLEAFTQDMDVGNIEDITDASYRNFEGDSGVMVLSMAITLKSTVSKDNLEELTGGFEQGLSESLGGIALQDLKSPALGDEAVLRYVEIADMGVSLYFLSFRKANAIGVIAVVGMSDGATEALTTEFGSKLEAKFK